MNRRNSFANDVSQIAKFLVVVHVEIAHALTRGKMFTGKNWREFFWPENSPSVPSG